MWEGCSWYLLPLAKLHDLVGIHASTMRIDWLSGKKTSCNKAPNIKSYKEALDFGIMCIYSVWLLFVAFCAFTLLNVYFNSTCKLLRFLDRCNLSI